MEFYIFNSYLKYKKENSPSIFKAMKRTPIFLWIILGLAVICSILGTVFSFIDGLAWLFFVFSLAEIIFTFTAFVLQERWEIKHSDMELEEFKTSSIELYNWLSNLSITSQADIELLLERLNDYRGGQIEKREKQNNKIDKWMQTLIIPLILAIITALISNQADIESVLIFIFFMLAIVAMIYGLIWLVRSVVGILQTQRRNKLDYFITDLQGVLDVVFIFNRSNNEQRDIVEQK